MITRVQNKDKHHRACPFYYYTKDRIDGGYKQNYLFTKDELIVARQRALKNSEDIPRSGLITWFKSLF